MKHILLKVEVKTIEDLENELFTKKMLGNFYTVMDEFAFLIVKAFNDNKVELTIKPTPVKKQRSGRLQG